jgi:transcriptional regulator with XRE-family HTH domain
MTTSVTPIRLTLQAEREKAGLTQVELAEAVGVRQATISRLESGVTKQIDLPLLERICKALRIEDPGALFVLEPEPPKKGRGKR